MQGHPPGAEGRAAGATADCSLLQLLLLHLLLLLGLRYLLLLDCGILLLLGGEVWPLQADSAHAAEEGDAAGAADAVFA
jgi:hypothetical protein